MLFQGVRVPYEDVEVPFQGVNALSGFVIAFSSNGLPIQGVEVPFHSV